MVEMTEGAYIPGYTPAKNNASHYPGGRHCDCDHYSKGKCSDKTAWERNRGRCDGHILDCPQWEITDR